MSFNDFLPHLIDGLPHVLCSELKKTPVNIKLIDVRSREEFFGELGHIQGAELITLGEDLVSYLKQEDKNATIIFVCRSGARSAQATAYALQEGFSNVANLKGGMLEWNQRS
jgi:sulfur dioxygenase